MPKPEPNKLFSLADQCVKCGLCLSSCPTYRHYSNEADSPRGRVTLIQALLNDQISASDDKLIQHLDGCLSCGNCESACPSEVQFIDLLDQAKQLFQLGKIPKWQLSLITSAKLLNAGGKVSNLLPRKTAVLLPGLLGKYLENRPEQFKRVLTPANAVNKPIGRVGIFTGCAGQVVDADAINLCSKLLNQLGYEVVIPVEQACCGAMHRHEGYADEADQFMTQNLSAFNQQPLDAVIYFASGCGTQLIKSETLFNSPVLEVTEFLARLALPETHGIDSAQTIALHSPCTLRNHTGAWPVMLELIKKLAGEQLLDLPENHLCCGSAGLHMLKQPDVAAAMLQPKLDALTQLKPDILLTANTGCALHFRNAIKKAKLATKVMHPAEWVSDQMLNRN